MVGTQGFCPTRQEKQILCTHDTYLISSVSGTLVYGSMALTRLLSSTGCGNRNKKKNKSLILSPDLSELYSCKILQLFLKIKYSTTAPWGKSHYLKKHN